MAADVRRHERADGHDSQAALAQVVEGSLDELRAEATPLRLDLGVHERDRARQPPVADLARELVVVEQLVAELGRVVDHAKAHASSVDVP